MIHYTEEFQKSKPIPNAPVFGRRELAAFIAKDLKLTRKVSKIIAESVYKALDEFILSKGVIKIGNLGKIVPVIIPKVYAPVPGSALFLQKRRTFKTFEFRTSETAHKRIFKASTPPLQYMRRVTKELVAKKDLPYYVDMKNKGIVRKNYNYLKYMDLNGNYLKDKTTEDPKNESK